MITIGIPVRNQFVYFKQLLESIKKYTNKKLIKRMVIIDDGSNPTLESANDVYINTFKNTILVRNDESVGFPKACNQIIQAANADFICILNSDTLVTPNWLDYLHKEMLKDPKIGIVGPSTSYANDPQCMRNICGKRHTMTEQDIVNYASLLKRHFKSAVDIGTTLTGFCMLIRKSALDKVGMFDEMFGLGSFEEADLCQRMMMMGFKCMWVPYAYVHHYGKITFGGEKIDWKNLWAENQEKFEAKWKIK